jgi:hypothetical protein
MDAVFKYLKKHVRQDQRVWIRSTPYGHAKCSKYKKPDTVPQVPTKKEGEYQWDLLESFDMVWKVSILYGDKGNTHICRWT